MRRGEDNVGVWESTRSLEIGRNKREDEEEENLHEEELNNYMWLSETVIVTQETDRQDMQQAVVNEKIEKYWCWKTLRTTSHTERVRGWLIQYFEIS